MLSARSSESDVKLYRRLFIIGAIAYFSFWFILMEVSPASFDPFIGRISVSLLILAAFLLSRINRFFRDKIVHIAYFLSYVLTFYYIFLLVENGYSTIYSIGMMTIVVGIAVVFQDSISLLLFLFICIASVGTGYFFVEDPEVKPFLYLSILATTSIVSYLVMSIRLNIQEELRVKNIRLENAYEEINEQKKIVEIKNNDITDSINYAKKIQQAIVPSKDGLTNHLSESFIYYRVKDIVSGDFYWYHKQNDDLLIAAVDCTGHGVPGALMSMIGVTLLNQTVVVQNIVQPGHILNNLQKEIYSFLQRGSNDGMDISLCSVNTKKMSLSFSSAMMRLVMVRNNSAKEIRGDRSPISHNTDPNMRFTNHTIDLVKGDTFYIFSDGYCDQFGGTKQKKFMYKRLEKLLLDIHRKDMKEQKTILENTHRDWRGNLEQVDDILVIGFRV